MSLWVIVQPKFGTLDALKGGRGDDDSSDDENQQKFFVGGMVSRFMMKPFRFYGENQYKEEGSN